MKSIGEHLDELDRMVEQGGTTDKIPSQIAFIEREVAALQASHSAEIQRLAQVGEEYCAECAKLEAELKNLYSANDKKAGKTPNSVSKPPIKGRMGR